MRWLFLVLLFLNVAYFVWQTNMQEKDLYANVSLLRDVKPIALMRELENEKQVEVSESSSTESIKLKNESNTEAAEDNTTVQSAQCYTFGPFHEEQTLLSLKKEMQSYAADLVVRDKKESLPTVHWVYVEPEVSRRKAIKLGKRLKAKKIKDFYIIRQGEKNNGISLGHFKNSKRAITLQSKVKKLGFNVHLEQISKVVKLFWLDYQVVDKEIPEALVKKYIQAVDKGKVGHQRRECEV